jgi:undecaprenyl-diphosphatase
MFAATTFDMYTSRNVLTWQDTGTFAVGFITAFISALLVIKGLLRYVAHHDFKVFAWYRIIFGTMVLIYFWP